MAANSLRGGKNVYGPHCLQSLVQMRESTVIGIVGFNKQSGLRPYPRATSRVI